MEAYPPPGAVNWVDERNGGGVTLEPYLDESESEYEIPDRVLEKYLILSSRLRRGHAASFGVCQPTITFKPDWYGALNKLTRVLSPSGTRRFNPPNEH